MSEEMWKSCPGFESKYEVSNLGRVRKSVPHKFSPHLKVLKPSPNGRGYLCVHLYRKGRSSANVRIHRLVAGAFLPPPREIETCVHHKNGDKHDNNSENLQWVTNRANLEAAKDMRLCSVSMNHPNRKLTMDQVEFIKSNKDIGLKELASKFKVSTSTIFAVRKRRTWNTVPFLFIDGDGI